MIASDNGVPPPSLDPSVGPASAALVGPSVTLGQPSGIQWSRVTEARVAHTVGYTIRLSCLQSGRDIAEKYKHVSKTRELFENTCKNRMRTWDGVFIWRSFRRTVCCQPMPVDLTPVRITASTPVPVLKYRVHLPHSMHPLQVSVHERSHLKQQRPPSSTAGVDLPHPPFQE